LVSVSAPVPQRLLDSVDESSVMAYVKDLEGRYLRVNQRYKDFFAVGGKEIRGRTDEELAPGQTVDGPRLASGTVSEDEPLQLEYTVGPFEGRPALAVWRFAVRTEGGDTVAVCGVAAPVGDAPLARRECERLMAAVHDTDTPAAQEVAQPRALDHTIAALHEASASAARRAHELLSELTEERERRAAAETRAANGDELRRRLEAAEAAILTERARADEAAAELNAARGELTSVRGRLEGVETTTQRESSRANEAEAALQRDRRRVEESITELGAARGELASVRGRLEAAETAVENERARAEEAVAAERATRTRAEEAELVVQATRSHADELRAELDATRAELASERKRWSQTEQEIVRDLRRRLEEADEAARTERSRAEESARLLDGARAELEAMQAELAATRAQLATPPDGEPLDELRHKLEHAEASTRRARERADAAEAALNAERADAEIRAGVAERRIAELEASLSHARAQELEGDAARSATGPTWDSSAQRAFTTALSQSSDWRVSVKSAIGVVGSRGGWDAVCAWQPDDLNGFASCFAMWTGENRRLGALETATWQRRQPLEGSTIGEALCSEETLWLAADPRAADRRLQLLAQHGIRGALIVPVKDGARPVAALELLTVGATEPTGDLIDALETIALQLGHFSHLLSAGAQPRWRFGRT
jgi:hypothetical protein